jgi:hypothetical protein
MVEIKRCADLAKFRAYQYNGFAEHLVLKFLYNKIFWLIAS